MFSKYFTKIGIKSSEYVSAALSGFCEQARGGEGEGVGRTVGIGFIKITVSVKLKQVSMIQPDVGKIHQPPGFVLEPHR